MPYRRAWWGMAVLAPVVLLAFWPQYYGDLGHAPLAFHAHGLTATVWLLLVGLQSWSAHEHDRSLHRASGLAVFAIVPLFAASAPLVVHSMAVKFVTHSHPFYAVMGARLGLHDVISTLALVGFVSVALAKRRKIALHGACMLATVLLVLPPVIARLPLPRVWHLGELIVILLAALLAWREPRGRSAFLALIAVQVVLIVLFEAVGPSAAWEAAFTAFSRWPVWPVSATAFLAALAALYVGWKRAPTSGKRSRSHDSAQPA